MELQAKNFSKAIKDIKAALPNCISVADGTVVRISFPKDYYMQKMVVYNEHKRKYSLKFQVINTSDYMIPHAHDFVD